MNYAAYPLVARFCAENPLFARTFAYSQEIHGDTFWQYGEEICKRLLEVAGSTEEYERYRRSFRRFVVESLREQLHVEEHGQNRHSDRQVVSELVYRRAVVMDAYYLPGMAFSQFGFANHLTLYRFYRERFLGETLGERGFDIGPGHGLLTVAALQQMPSGHLTIIDISPSACRFTERMLLCAGMATDRYTLIEGAMEEIGLPPKSYSFGICSKVLEHVADPAQFLGHLHAALASGGRLYLATDIGVGSADHLQIFSSVQVVEALLLKAGFVLQEAVTAPLYPHDPDRAGVLDYGAILCKPA